jgi:hypothetical protein
LIPFFFSKKAPVILQPRFCAIQPPDQIPGYP